MEATRASGIHRVQETRPRGDALARPSVLAMRRPHAVEIRETRGMGQSAQERHRRSGEDEMQRRLHRCMHQTARRTDRVQSQDSGMDSQNPDRRNESGNMATERRRHHRVGGRRRHCDEGRATGTGGYPKLTVGSLRASWEMGSPTTQARRAGNPAHGSQARNGRGLVCSCLYRSSDGDCTSEVTKHARNRACDETRRARARVDRARQIP